MLRLVVPEEELFDERTSEFINVDSVELELEHSLLSLSKWESFFEKSFLGTDDKTDEEVMYYVWCMVLDDRIDQSVLKRLSPQNLREINEYISSKQSATTFGEMPSRPGRGEVITAELIYYWMVAFTIPFECEAWHLNRLFSLIKICNIKNSKPQKQSKQDVAKRYQEINAQRKAKLGTTG
jgi:hypothetical protein